MIHTTIGVYQDGSYKMNGVDPKDLEEHIEYNKSWRPGRLLLVDGKCVHQGYFKDEKVQEIEEKFQHMKADKITLPYR